MSPSVLAYCSDLPVSVANRMVALILLDNAIPNKFEVNFTALKKKTKYCVQHLFKGGTFPTSKNIYFKVLLM